MTDGATWRRIPRITVDTARVWYQAAHYSRAAWLPRAVSHSSSPGAPHLLLLARSLPPRVDGGVYRSLALIRQASLDGWRVTALSQPASGSPGAAGIELRDRLPSQARMIHWEWSDLEIGNDTAPSLDGGFTSISRMVEAAWKSLGRDAPTLVVAAGPTFAEFVGAMTLADRWRVPFALDYRDEWSQGPYYNGHTAGSDRFWEACCLRRASLVTFTTTAQQEHQLRAFPVLDRGRSAVVTNGWDEQALVDHAVPSPPALRERAVIRFLGTLGHRSDLPEFLATLRGAVAARDELRERVAFEFIGNKEDVEHRLLHAFEYQGMLGDRAHVPLSAAQAAMRQSHALLLLNPPLLARSVPGKAYEYLASGTRILLYGEGGELEHTLGSCENVVRVRRGNAGELAEALRVILYSGVPSTASPAVVSCASLEQRASEHLALLNRISAGARGIGAASPPLS